VKIGELPRFGAPNPAEAIRKLAVHLTDVREARIRVTVTLD